MWNKHGGHAKFIFSFLFDDNNLCTIGARLVKLGVETDHKHSYIIYTRMYPKISGLAVWSEKCKWYNSLPLGAVVSLLGESV
jgi:hypothetical protein